MEALDLVVLNLIQKERANKYTVNDCGVIVNPDVAFEDLGATVKVAELSESVWVYGLNFSYSYGGFGYGVFPDSKEVRSSKEDCVISALKEILHHFKREAIEVKSSCGNHKKDTAVFNKLTTTLNNLENGRQ